MQAQLVTLEVCRRAEFCTHADAELVDYWLEQKTEVASQIPL